MTASPSFFRSELKRICRDRGDAPAVVLANPGTGAPLITYRDLGELVDRFGAFLQQHGMVPGQRVVSILPNSLAQVVAFLSCAAHGFGFAPTSCDAPAARLLEWIRLTDPALVLVPTVVAPEVRAALQQSGRRIAEIDAAQSLDWLSKPAVSGVATRPGHLCIGTSGTEGDPKAIVIDCDRLWRSGQAFLNHHGVRDPALRFWNYLPMSYLGGLFNLTLIPICIGGSFVLDEPFSGKSFLFFWQVVQRHDINALWLVPTILKGVVALAERGRRPPQQLRAHGIRHAFLGTAPIEAAAKRRFEDLFGVRPHENYGLSETTFVTSEAATDPNPPMEGGVGQPLPYVDMTLRTLDGQAAVPGGEIRVKSPFLFLGYLQVDGRIVLPLDADGYFATGDLGQQLPDGTVVLKGRLREIIKKGGYMVSLREIEVLALGNGAAQEVAAVPVAHEFYGESYELCVVLREQQGAPPSEDEFTAWLHDTLPRHQWPEKVRFIKELPKTASGKVKKHALSETSP